MFRKSVILSLMAIVLAVAAACGSDPTSVPRATDAPAPPVATALPTNTPQPTATLRPGETPQPTATSIPATRTPVPRPTAVPTTAKPYFEGKTMIFIASFSPGGGHDFTTRLLAKYMPQYLPGNPQAIVRTITGAGGIISANQVYNNTKPDGLTVLDMTGLLLTNQIVGSPGVQFDLNGFPYLGVVNGGPMSCQVWHESGVTTMQEIIDSPEPIVFGSSVPTAWAVNVLKDFVGGNIKVVAGYSGSTAQAAVALEQGEIDGWCTLFQAWTGARPQWVEDNLIIPVLQLTDDPAGDSLLVEAGVPNLLDFQDQMTPGQLQIAVAANAPNVVQLLFPTVPGTPDNIVAMLREAFWNAVTNPDFVADSVRTGRPVNPIPGDDVQAMIAQLLDVSPELVEGLKELVG